MGANCLAITFMVTFAKLKAEAGQGRNQYSNYICTIASFYSNTQVWVLPNPSNEPAGLCQEIAADGSEHATVSGVQLVKMFTHQSSGQ